MRTSDGGVWLGRSPCHRTANGDGGTEFTGLFDEREEYPDRDVERECPPSRCRMNDFGEVGGEPASIERPSARMW